MRIFSRDHLSYHVMVQRTALEVLPDEISFVFPFTCKIKIHPKYMRCNVILVGFLFLTEYSTTGVILFMKIKISFRAKQISGISFVTGMTGMVNRNLSCNTSKCLRHDISSQDSVAKTSFLLTIK